MTDGGRRGTEEGGYGLRELAADPKLLQRERLLLGWEEARERDLKRFVRSKAELVLRKLDIREAFPLRYALDDTVRVLYAFAHDLDFHPRPYALLEPPEGGKCGIGNTGRREEGAGRRRGGNSRSGSMDGRGVGGQIRGKLRYG